MKQNTNLKIYKLNLEKSKQLYEKCKISVRTKECYGNVYRTSITAISLFPGIEMVYGAYMIGHLGVYVRHAFFLHEGEVIDPTVFTIDDNLDPTISKYLVAKIYNFDSLMEALERENYCTHLPTDTRIAYGELIRQLQGKGEVLLG